MRRIWALVLGVVMVAFVVGCGKQEKKVVIPDKVPPPPPGGPVSGASAAPGGAAPAGVPVKK